MGSAVAKNRVVKIDSEGNLETIKGEEAGYLVSILYRDRAFYANKLLGGALLFDTSGLDEKNKRPRTAVHNGHFRCADIDIGIVYTKARHG